MNGQHECMDRLYGRALRRRWQRQRIAGFLFLAFIYLVGLVTGWAIQAVNSIK